MDKFQELFLFFDKDKDNRIGLTDAFYLPLFGVSLDVLRVAWGFSDIGKKGFFFFFLFSSVSLFSSFLFMSFTP